MRNQKRHIRLGPGLGALFSALFVFALAAAPAIAARTYNSQVKEGFNSPNTVAFEANNDFWVSDAGHTPPETEGQGQFGIYKISAFPSQELLAVPNTFAAWEFYILDLSVGVDQENGEVFASQANGREVDVFTPASETNKCPAGEPVCFTHRWTGINGVTNCCGGDIHIAVDNSHGYSRGRIYLSITAPENDVEAFDSGDRPVDFPATASYIRGNRLIGTPAGPFSSVEQVSVDGNGDLFATDTGKGVVDEFDSTGTFLRTFPAPSASGGYYSPPGGVGVDPTNGNVVITEGGPIKEYDSSGNVLGTVERSSGSGGVPAFNSEGYLYSTVGGAIDIFNPAPPVPRVTYSAVTKPTTTAGTLNAMIDPNGGGEVTACRFEYVEKAAFNPTDTNAVQTLNVSGATGGTFSLGFKGQTSSATGTGNLSGATGQGDLSAGSKEVTNLTTKTGVFAVGQEITAAGIPGGTTIAAIGSGSLELSQPATETATAAELSAGSKKVTNLTTKTGVFAVGEPITAAGIPGGTTIAAIGSGSLELSQPATETATAAELSAGMPLSFEAEPSSVQSALEAMNTIGPGDVSVTGTSGGPFRIEFVGELAGTAMPQLTVDSSSLTPPGATASVETTTQGGRWSGGTEIPCLNEANEEVDTHPIPNATTAAVHAAISGLTSGTTYEYRVVAGSANGTKYGEDQTYTPAPVLALSTEPATQVGESAATLNASFVGNGEKTEYGFEWGPTEEYGNKTPMASAEPSGGTSEQVSAPLTGLNFYSTYHYRVVAKNGGGISHGADRTFTTTPGVPSGRNLEVTEVHSDRAVMHGEVDPNGAPTTANFEYVDGPTFKESGWKDAKAAPIPGVEVGMGKQYSKVSVFVNGLKQGTLYHYRVEGTNSTGTGGSEATFATFPFIPALNDPCPNAHVRQQTGSALLLDCRGYELVSASSTGGYDVESSLVVGQTPFGGYPEAQNSEGEPEVLYGVHDGGIPGTGYPTNRGVDPYVATRTEAGWQTRYVGIPADNPYASAPFSSNLLEASPSLETLAFGGPEICSPCFKDGSTGNPIHLPNGELVQGMVGEVSQPKAQPAGFIGKHLSADGAHFVFGSKSRFEPDGNEGETSIYDRNLVTHETHVVSKTPAGQTMKEEGKEIGELDISKDGSHIVIGQLVAEAGDAKYWHLYMNIGDSAKTLDLTPGTTSGVLYDGMTEDGSKVFFTTADKLTGEDKDSSPDIYEAEISGESATLHLISKGNNIGEAGEAGNSDNCDPSANTNHEHWNTTGEEENCGVVAVGGGGGVAKRNGTIYFLSPELLDGAESGVQNAPNLYVVTPGSTPHFIATLESSSNAPLPLSEHPFVREFGSFGRVAGTAIDHATGDFYGLDIETEIGTGYVYKFNSAGHPDLEFGSNGKLTVPGVLGFYNLPCEIAVDNSSSINHGFLYVPDVLEGVVNVYNGNENPEHKTGKHEATIAVGDSVTGISVDPATGEIYVVGFSGYVYVYNTKFELLRSFETSSGGATGLAVDSTGKVYIVNGGGFGAKGTTQMYSSTGTYLGELDPNPSYAVAVDPKDNNVYVDEGNQITEFDSSGNKVGRPTGAGKLSGSFGVSADYGTLAAGNPSEANIAVFGKAVLPPDQSTDNPLVIDSVSAPGARETGDFQTTPSGQYAAFTSSLPLTGYNNATHREIFRYDGASNHLDCGSCNPTGEQATGDASMAPNGLSLTDDGRLFFNSTEGLVDRDLNNKVDVYEWEPNGFRFDFESHNEPKSITCEESGGCIQLISSGTAPLGSDLLGTSSSGTDAFFFTRDTLVSSDLNGNRVKIYDARSLSGYPQLPPPHQCQASDECHGPGSAPPPPPEIKSDSLTPGGNEPKQPLVCRKGKVKRHGHCVKKRNHRRHRKHRRHRNAYHNG
jgi:hypothetical protein